MSSEKNTFKLALKATIIGLLQEYVDDCSREKELIDFYLEDNVEKEELDNLRDKADELVKTMQDKLIQLLDSTLDGKFDEPLVDDSEIDWESDDEG